MSKSRSRSRSRLLLIALVLAVGAIAWSLHTQWGKLRPAHVVTIEGFPDISDLAWLEHRKTFIAVSDEEFIGEIDLQGNVLSQRNYPAYDLESITILPGIDDQVMVMDECGSRMVWFSVPELDIIKEQALPVKAIVGSSCNKKIEGMALQGDDGIVLANEGPATLLFFDRALTKLKRSISVDSEYISEVIELYDGSLLVVSRDAGLRLYSARGQALGPWREVSYGFIEGGVFVPDHGLVLCVDRATSSLLFFPNLRNDESIKAFFQYSSVP